MSTTEDTEEVVVLSEEARKQKSSDVAEADMANGGIKDTKDRSRGRSSGRGYGMGGRGGYRGSRGGVRGSYRGKRGSMNMFTKYLDAKAMYLQFEDAINSITANEILEYGREAVSVGFGRGCTLHFESPEEAKEMMDKIKEHTFCGLEAKVEYAYKKKTAEPEKRSSGDDNSEASPIKKAKVEGQAEEVKNKEEEEHNEGKEEDEGEGEEDAAEEEGEGDEDIEGDDDVEGEEHLEGDYGEEAQDENEEEEEYEDAENPAEENEDDDDDE